MRADAVPSVASQAYTTLLKPHECEIDKVKRSRFIGLASPCGSVDQAKASLDAARLRFHDARHCPYAWRIGEATRAADDGEPHHSAGSPILREIEGRGLRDVLVVVVRYFGGVKLGTGGLARAFGAAAAAVLDGAELQRVALRVPLQLRYDYSSVRAVQRALSRLEITPVDADYGEQITLILHVPADRVQRVLHQLRDASGGAVQAVALPPVAIVMD